MPHASAPASPRQPPDTRRTQARPKPRPHTRRSPQPRTPTPLVAPPQGLARRLPTTSGSACSVMTAPADAAPSKQTQQCPARSLGVLPIAQIGRDLGASLGGPPAHHVEVGIVDCGVDRAAVVELELEERAV